MTRKSSQSEVYQAVPAAQGLQRTIKRYLEKLDHHEPQMLVWVEATDIVEEDSSLQEWEIGVMHS